MEEERFSVAQWFPDDSYEVYVKDVPHVQALYHFGFLTSNVMARVLKMTKAVRVIDSMDCCVVEWIQGKGITFPPEMAGKPTAPLLNLRRPDGSFLTEEDLKDG